MNNTNAVYEIDQLESTQLAKNLNFLIKKAQLSEGDFARALDLPLTTIRRLTSGETGDPRISTLKIIADYFGITVDSLLEEQDDISVNCMAKNKPIFLPILNWSIISKIHSLQEFDLSIWKNWEPVTIKPNFSIGQNAFILESTTSMYPRYPHGTMFVIDPAINPADGDIILIKSKTSGDTSLKELRIEVPHRRLLPVIHGADSVLFSDDEYGVLGTVLLTLLYKHSK
jgi:transcriptional regulator with XRE-family HTH domain